MSSPDKVNLKDEKSDENNLNKPKAESPNKEDSDPKEKKHKKKDRSRDRDRSRDKDRRRSRSRDRPRERDKDRDRSREKDRNKSSRKSDKDEKSKTDAVKEPIDEKGSDNIEGSTEPVNAEESKVEEKPKSNEKRSRSKSRDRKRSRSSSRGRKDRRRDSSRDRRRDSSRDRRRESSRDRYRNRDRYRDRDRDRSRSRSDDRRRRDKDKKETASEPEYKPMTLKEIIAANPGISIPEAVKRLNAYNTAAAGAAGASIPAPPPPPVSLISIPTFNIPPPPPPPTVPPPTLPPGTLQLGVIDVSPASIIANIPNQPGLIGVGPKPARELYIGNLPPGVTIPQLTQFLNTTLKNLGVCDEKGTVMSCWINEGGHFAFVEFRTIEESNSAMIYLSGMQIGQFQLKVGRPKTMGPGGPPMPPSLLESLNMSLPIPSNIPGYTGISTTNTDTSNVVLMTNLPAAISEEQVRELISPFGEINALNLMMDPKGSTKSAAFEFVNSSATESVIVGLNGLPLGPMKLALSRVPATMAAALLVPASKSSTTTPKSDPSNIGILKTIPPTTVLRMSNMVSDADLEDDQSFNELQEDISDECNSHGSVRSIIIPRPSRPGQTCPGLKEIFVQFSNIEGAEKTKKAVTGKTFGGNPVVVYFYPESLFRKQEFDMPDGFIYKKEDEIEDTNGCAVIIEEEMD